MKTYLIIFIILSSYFAESQELKLNDGGLVTDGDVSCIRNYGDTIGIGGTFNYLGQHTGALVQIDTSNGSIIAGLPKVYGSVSTIISDGQNGFYIGGLFDRIGTTSIKNLAHINANYTIDLAFNPSPNGGVKTLINKGTTLYVLGNFTQITGVSRNYLAEINRNTGVVTSWNPNSSASIINTIALVLNKIIVGGSFTTIAGQSRNNIAAFDTLTNNIVNTFIPNFNGSITKIISKNSRVYILGNFTTVNSVARNSVACLFENGNLLNFTISLLSGSYIQDLIPYKDSIIISIGNPGLLPYINKYDTLGAVTNLFTNITFGSEAGQSISLIGIVNDKLIITTSELTTANIRKIRYAVLDLKINNLVFNWNDNSNAAINCVLNFRNTLLLGGAFSSVGGSEKKNVALFSSSTNTIFPFNPQFTSGFSKIIHSIDIKPNGIFVAGVQYNSGNSSGRLWLFWNNGFKAKELTASFPTTTNGTSVTAMKVINNLVYIAGKFDQIGTTINRVRAAVLDTSLTTIGSFPGPGHTNTLADGQGRISEINNDTNGNIIYVGGQVFDKLGGIVRGTFYSLYMLSNSGLFIRSLNNLMAYVKRIKIDRDSAYYIDPNGGIGTRIISSGTSYNLFTSLPPNNEFTSIEVVKNNIIYSIRNNSLNDLSILKGFNKTTNIANSITYDSIYGVCNDALYSNNKLYFIGQNLQNKSQNEPISGFLTYSVLENKPTINSSNLVISSITNTSMTLNWTVGNGIGRIIVAKQLNLATSIPVSGVIYSPNSIFGQGSLVGTNNFVVYNGNGNTVTITGLSINQSYQFSIYEYNGIGSSINYLTSIVNGIGTTLPVKLISFNATLANEKVNCTWETASETNNDYFTLERSKDGNSFEIVGNVKGQGNSNSNIRYSYTDINPFSGISYYRLLQTDFDGKNTYSTIKKVGENVKLTTEFSLYYENNNPIVKINSLAENSVTIELLNLNGVKLFTNEHTINIGENTFGINGNITTGLYLLKVQMENKVEYFKVWVR
jgi:hypothetical protein